MRNLFLIVACFCSSHVFSLNADTGNTDPLEALSKVERLETGRIYESGEVSSQTSSFNEILNSKSATKNFNKLFEISKTNAARLYALTGLHSLDIEQYRKLSKTLDLEKNVDALWFDIKKTQSIRSWLALIESGEMLAAFKWSPSEKRD